MTIILKSFKGPTHTGYFSCDHSAQVNTVVASRFHGSDDDCIEVYEDGTHTDMYTVLTRLSDGISILHTPVRPKTIDVNLSFQPNTHQECS